jgi:hypothetical protein
MRICIPQHETTARPSGGGGFPMAKSLTYRFCDLPLIIDGPFEDNGVEGEAEITYWADGEFSIKSISITTYRSKTPAEMEVTGLTSRRVPKEHLLDAGTPLFLILHDRLENGRYTRANIQEEVRCAINDEAADHADFLADQRRDDRMMAGMVR